MPEGNLDVILYHRIPKFISEFSAYSIAASTFKNQILTYN